MASLPNELLFQILGHCVSGANPSEYLQLRLVNRCVHDEVTRPLFRHWLSHITVEGRDFRSRDQWVLSERTRPAVEHLTVQLECAETEEERAGQPSEYATALHGLLESCKNIRSVHIAFDKDSYAPRGLTDKIWGLLSYEDLNMFRPLRDELQKSILDQTAALSGKFFKEEDGRRNIRVNFSNPGTLPTHPEITNGLMSCAGRNPGMILVQNHIDSFNREEWVLENAGAGRAPPGGTTPGTPERPAKHSHRIALKACDFMKHILDNHRSNPLPCRIPDFWRLVAEHVTEHRHKLIGASTASTRDLNVPDGIREPFDVAASELGRAAELFEEHARQGHVDRARSHLSQAYTVLKAACDAEDILVEMDNLAADPPRTKDWDDPCIDSSYYSSPWNNSDGYESEHLWESNEEDTDGWWGSTEGGHGWADGEDDRQQR